jgi:MFS transporter, AAHS family, benzoate transport protein
VASITSQGVAVVANSPVNPREQYAGWVAPLRWFAVALEGFDLVVLGVVLPSLLREPTWHLDPHN